MQTDVVQHDHDLHANRRQEVQVLDAETVPLAEAIDLDDAEAFAVLVDERDTDDRVQIQRRDRVARLEALVALQVLADQADTFVEGSPDDRSAKRKRRQVASLAGPLGPNDEVLPFAEDDHDTVRLREQLHELFEQLIEQRIEFERARQLLSDIENHLELGCRILREQLLIHAGGANGFTDDDRGFLRLGHGGRRVGAQRQQIGADLECVSFAERTGNVGREARAVDERAVAAVQIFDEMLPVLIENPRMLPADLLAGETDGTIGISAQRGAVVLQREVPPRFRTLQNNDDAHADVLPDGWRRCKKFSRRACSP